MNTEKFNKIYNRATLRVHKLTFLSSYREKYLTLNLRDKILIYLSLRDFNKCLRWKPNHWPSMFLKGKIYQRLGDFNKALNLFEQAYSIEKFNTDILREAALTCIHIDNPEKAIFYDTEALKLKPDDYALLGNFAMHLLLNFKDQESLETIEKALLVNPGNKINEDIKMVVENVINGKMKRPTCKETIG